jgi:outer membrane protein TolC
MKMKNYYIVILTALLTFNACGVFAQTKMTPDEAVKIALSNNYSIQIAKNQSKIAENNYSAAATALLPTLDATGSYTKSKTNTKLEFFNGGTIDRNGANSSNLSAGVTLNWTIFDGFKMFAALDQLKELNKTGKTNFKASLESNVSGVLTTYYDIVRQKEVLDVIDKNITISNERVKIAESKKNVGAGSKFDLLRAQVDLNEDRSSYLQGVQNLSDLKVKLNQLLGRNPGTEFDVIDTIAIDTTLSYDALKGETQKYNTELTIARQNKSVADANLTLARGDIYPTISLNLGYNFLKSESEAGYAKSNQNSGINYGVTASFNLFNGLQTRRDIENAEISIDNSSISLKNTESQVSSDLLNAYKRYRNALELVTLDSENLKVAEENVSIALEKLKLGSIIPVEFRETQTQMVSAKSSLVTAQYQAKTAETDLLRISGRLIKSE